MNQYFSNVYWLARPIRAYRENYRIQGRGRIMKIVTADGKGIETGTAHNSYMESSIRDTMRRYFQGDSGRPRQDLEDAIMASMKRYFEGPSH